MLSKFGRFLTKLLARSRTNRYAESPDEDCYERNREYSNRTWQSPHPKLVVGAALRQPAFNILAVWLVAAARHARQTNKMDAKVRFYCAVLVCFPVATHPWIWRSPHCHQIAYRGQSQSEGH
jgi:hypothetical protein